MGLAVLALAPATVLMGATLPTLTRYLTRSGHLSAAFGKLYAANTIGAIVGTLVAGVVLIELFGLTGALGGRRRVLRHRGPRRAVAVARSGKASDRRVRRDRRGRREQRAEPRRTRRPSLAAERPDRTRLALGIAFVSGLTSLGYQVLWTRLLASGTGNTTYVFTVILALFLIGLAIGALLFKLIRSRIGDPTGCSRRPRSWSARSCCSGSLRSSLGRAAPRSVQAARRASARWSGRRRRSCC